MADISRAGTALTDGGKSQKGAVDLTKCTLWSI
jgi:hypothetical protein